MTVTLLWVGLVSAQPGRSFHRARLVWQVDARASRCAHEDAFRQEVSRRLGASPFDPAADTELTVSVRSEGTALEGRVQTPGASGTALRVPWAGCAELVTLLAGRSAVFLEDDTAPAPLDAAVALPDAAVALSDAPDAPAPVDAAATAPDLIAPPPPAAARERPWRVELAVGPSPGLSGDPATVSLGLSVSVRLRVHALSFGVEAAGALPLHAAQSADGVSLHAASARGLAMACVHPWRLGLCALGGAAVSPVSITDARANQRDGVVFTQGALGGRFEAELWQARRFGLGAHVDAVALPAPAVVRLPDGASWRMGWVLSFAIDARFTIL